MAKITRKVMKIFGVNAGPNQIGKFGSLAAGTPEYTMDPDEVQELGNYLTGWYGGVVGANSPALQDQNALHYLYAYQLAYLFQSGIPEWNAETTYYIGSYATNSSGDIFMSIADDNTNNALTSTANWSRVFMGTDSPLTLENCTIAASVNANALTIALKDKNGNDPSASSPVIVATRSLTANNGTYTLRRITSALSVTVPSGASLGTVNGVGAFVYAYLCWNGSSFVLGVGGPGAYGEVDTSLVVSPGTLNASSQGKNILYTVAGANVAARYIGKIFSTQATAGTWATAPSSVNPNMPFLPIASELSSGILSAAPDFPLTTIQKLGGTKDFVSGVMFDGSKANAAVLTDYREFSQSVSFTSNGSGGGSGSGTVKATKCGNVVTVTFPAFTATPGSGCTGFTTSAVLPSWAQPPVNVWNIAGIVRNNGGLIAEANSLTVNNDGTLGVSRYTPGTAYTNAPGAGIFAPGSVSFCL